MQTQLRLVSHAAAADRAWALARLAALLERRCTLERLATNALRPPASLVHALDHAIFAAFLTAQQLDASADAAVLVNYYRGHHQDCQRPPLTREQPPARRSAQRQGCR